MSSDKVTSQCDVQVTLRSYFLCFNERNVPVTGLLQSSLAFQNVYTEEFSLAVHKPYFKRELRITESCLGGCPCIPLKRIQQSERFLTP